MSEEKKDLKKVLVRQKLPKVNTRIKAGPTRRGDLDHIGQFNFKVEIEGVTAG
jgi:hypothetical protein